MRVKRSRANGRPATTPTVILVMTVEAVIAICLPRREKFKMSINKILRVAPGLFSKDEKKSPTEGVLEEGRKSSRQGY
jgi:hypothetical protein